MIPTTLIIGILTCMALVAVGLMVWNKPDADE